MFNLFKKKNFEEISLNCPRCGVGMKKIKRMTWLLTCAASAAVFGLIMVKLISF